MNSLNVYENIKSYLFMTIGLFIYVFSWTAFLLPHQIAGGGLSGLASVINYASGFPVSYSYIIINSMLFIIGTILMGKSFGFKTIYCIIVATLMFEFLPLIPWISDIEDKLLNSLIGGTMGGIGIGIIFLQGGSTGGTDIVALLITKFKETSPGRVFIVCDFVIIGSVLLIPDKLLTDVIYGYIQMVSFSYVIDLVITGNKQSIQIFIFSAKYADIAESINNHVQRGVTALSSMGWYSKEESKVLVVLCKKTQLHDVTQIVRRIDNSALMSVSNVMGVYGRGFDQIKGGKIQWKKQETKEN